MTNLGDLLGTGWSSTVATGINNAGDIVGYGIAPYIGNMEAFELLWVPKAGAMQTGEYVNAADHNALAAALHPTETHDFGSVGHGPG